MVKEQFVKAKKPEDIMMYFKSIITEWIGYKYLKDDITFVIIKIKRNDLS